MDILTKLILPTQEYGIYFLCIWVFFNFLQQCHYSLWCTDFSPSWFILFLIFILFEAILNGAVFWISLLVSLLLHRNASDSYNHWIYFSVLMMFLWKPHGFLHIFFCHLKTDNFTSFWWDSFYFFYCLNDLARILSTDIPWRYFSFSSNIQ